MDVQLVIALIGLFAIGIEIGIEIGNTHRAQEK